MDPSDRAVQPLSEGIMRHTEQADPRSGSGCPRGSCDRGAGRGDAGGRPPAAALPAPSCPPQAVPFLSPRRSATVPAGRCLCRSRAGTSTRGLFLLYFTDTSSLGHFVDIYGISLACREMFLQPSLALAQPDRNQEVCTAPDPAVELRPRPLRLAGRQPAASA